VKKRICIPKKNERVIFVESMKLSSSLFLHHYTVTLLGKKVHFLDPTLIEKVRCLMMLQRELLGWCKWFLSTIKEGRKNNGV